jgi:hypothetical protein
VEELAGFGVRVHTCARHDANLQECLRRWRADARLARVTASVCDVSVRGDRERLVWPRPARCSAARSTSSSTTRARPSSGALFGWLKYSNCVCASASTVFNYCI